MKYFHKHAIKSLYRAVFAALLLCAGANAQKYGTLMPSTLECSRTSLALGIIGLPACGESLFETLDDVQYDINAVCDKCSVETYIFITPIHLRVGLTNGPCTVGVAWTYKGGAYPAAGINLPYIGGALSARSSVAWAKLYSSVDCNDVPFVTGDNGKRLDCI